MQVAPQGRERAGSSVGGTTRHLLVFEEGSIGAVTEAEVASSACRSALPRFQGWCRS